MKSIIDTAVKYLNQKKIILYPTDTIWGVGCDAMVEESISKIYEIKQRPTQKKIIVLFSDMKMVYDYFETEMDLSFVSQCTSPTTFVLNVKNKLPDSLQSEQGVAIRIPNNPFCQKLISAFGKPILSTSANISGDIAPKKFYEISKLITNSVDYSIPAEYDTGTGSPSSIIFWSDNNFLKVR